MLERPGVVSVGDQVVFEGTVHAVVAIAGAKIRLLSEAGEPSVVALPFLLAAEDFELVGSAPAPKLEPINLLESLPEKVLVAAKDWERHVIEVETGRLPGAPEHSEPRLGYDPAVFSLKAREKQKAGELTASGLKTSPRTVERMRQRYREQGVWGLVDTRFTRSVEPTGQVDPRVVAAAIAVIDAQTGTSTGTKSRVIAKVQRMLDDEHGPGSCRFRRKPRSRGCWMFLPRGGTRSGRRLPGGRRRTNPTRSIPLPRRLGRVNWCIWTPPRRM
ncbi:hypothetical protein [Nocardia amamiensis]|uniref:hypothetical protein n=1 Tax=Nocardia amamiensis TaxID=404578 RepID=UPI001E2B689F|nr:hypothetical protein [Nocardia amamiensis]